MKKICNKCGKEYFKGYNESKKAWGSRLYCSQNCANSVNALKNGRPFKKGMISPRKGKKFPELSGKNNKLYTSVEKTCLQCGAIFIVRHYRKHTANFCSKMCANKHHDFGITPIHTRIRKSREYAIWRTAVFMRDDYTCQMCGQKGGTLNADHIKPFSKYPELRLAIDNGRTLCIECHKQTDTYGFSAWRNNFLERLGY